MQPQDTTPISVRGVSKSFLKRQVLNELSLQVARGTIVGLLGANGSGKTTLLRILLGLLPRDSGIAQLYGANADDLPAEIRERIGYVPQSSQLFAWLTGRSMLRYVGSFYANYDPEYANSVADRLQVSLKTPIAALSPGQQQRLSIVRALATRPEVLVLDEPMAALDPAARLFVIEELLREHQSRGLTVIVSSHIVHDLQRYCTHLAVVKDGRIVIHEPMEFFAGLVRAVASGEEPLLSQAPLAKAIHVRNSNPGERTLVVAQNSMAELERALPARIALQPLDGDFEAVLSEWMR
jgi:ABC-2 type transport system ATP-binding protein